MSEIRTPPSNDTYRINFDRIFKKPTKEDRVKELEAENSRLFAEQHQRRYGARP